ncbi:MAG TPA: thioredoxin domain-containing protein [Kofleriaceae bacterium]|jgi:protein-disulfide isomerase|nr:thioredoxin domain-containing protein [Kofleriaceae bacterium]
MRAVSVVGWLASLAILTSITLWCAPARADRLSFDPGTVYKVPLGNAPASGPADAPVTIVAWSDYTCGYCNRVQGTLDHLARLYPGQLRWIHRTLLLDDDNTLGAEAALAAAAQGRFLPMNDRLYALGGHVDRAAVELLARELGLDMVRFRADLDTHAYRPSIELDLADARALGVMGTPTFFVNGRPVHGNQPLQVFVEIVEQELARAAKQPGSYEDLVAAGKPAADAPPDARNERHSLDRTTLYRVGLGLPGHQIGPDDALVTIVVWSDFQCPFCAKQAPVLAHLRDKYKDDVRIIYRHFAMGFHRNAALAAEAGVAAAEQGKFWAFHDQVFANFGHLERADLEQFAEAAELDLPAFRAALDERRYHDAIVAEAASAEALGVDGTPTMFINGLPVGGARDIATMDRLVELHLAKARAMTNRGIAPADFYALLMSSAEGDDRADPSRIPSVAAIRIELRSDERARAVAAACRRRDVSRAAELAGGLVGDVRRRAALICAGLGIDLP